MSKPQANARYAMYGGARMPNPNQNYVHTVNNIPGNIFQQHAQHAQQPPPPIPSAQYNNYPRLAGPNNLQSTNQHLQQMSSALANQNSNNVPMNYAQPRPNMAPSLPNTMVFSSPLSQFNQYHLLQNPALFNHPPGNHMYYLLPPRPQAPPSSQPQMPPQQIQQSHLYTQNNSYSPGPPQHQPAPAPAPQPQAPPAKAQRDKKIIPIIDPKTNRNVIEDMEQQQASQQTREQQQTTTNTRQIEDLHGGVHLYEREELVSLEQQAPAIMPHITHMMHHHHHQAQPIRLLHHPSPSPPMIPHPQILQRPPSGNQMTHSPPMPTRPSSTPSSVVQSPLVNDNIESLHSQAHVNSIPTVSALSTGPEVDLADLNQKVLSNHVPNMINKNKHKTGTVVIPPNLNRISACDETPHHFVNNNSTPLVSNLRNQSPLDLHNTSSYPIHSNSSDQNPINYQNQTKFFPEVDTESSHDSQYPEDGSYFNQQNNMNQQAQKNYSNVSVLKRSANASKSPSFENIADQSLNESNGHPAVSDVSLCQQNTESQDEIQEQAHSTTTNVSDATLLPEPSEEIIEDDDYDSSVPATASPLPVAQNLPPLKLKHSYQLDQWSPINQDGFKKYSRDFLLKLKNEAMSRPKPANLPDLEIVLKDFSKTNHAKNSSHNSMFTPHYLAKPVNIRQNARQLPVIKPRSIQSGKVSKPASKSPNIVLSISLKDDIKLRESENAWRPNNTIDEDEKFYKEVRGVLNKLTPENFESLKQQFKDFPINTTKRLDKVIDLVFQKAIAEPGFSEFYAKMCYEMMKKEVIDDTKPIEDGKHQSVNFKHLLLNKCQVEFDKNETEERKNDIRLEEIKSEKDPEKQKELRLLFEEEERLIRKRSVGNCRFIGELYKLNMLTTFIMHDCLKKLLKKKEEEPLERACKLLSTIGKDLESHDKDPSKMRGYFNTMEELASKKNSHIISSRVRFMLQDVIDLRKNKWIPRRNENRPKTIQQIAYEAESEKFGMNLNKKSLLPSPTLLEGDRKAAFQLAQKEWKPHQPTYKTNNFVIDKTKFASVMRESPTDLKLGPSSKNVWHQGSNINKTSDSQWNSKSSSESNNFNPGFNSDIRTTKTSSYKSPYKATTPAPFSTENRYSALHNTNALSSGSGKPELPISMRSRIRKESSDTERVLLEQLMAEKRNFCKIYFDEYFCYNDFSELLQSTQKQEISNIDVCYFAFEIGTQLSNTEYHRNISNLIIEIHKHGISEGTIICDAMRDFFQNTIENDLYTDTPYLSKYIAEIIAPLIEVDVISFSDLRLSTKCLKTEHVDFCLPLLRELLKILGFNKAPTWLQKKWNVADLKLSDFISNNEKLVHVYPFFFLGPMDKADFSTVIKMTCNDDLKTRIKDVIISHEHIPCDDVSLCVDLVNWTKGNFGSSEDLSSGYFRALTSALCEISIIKNQEKLNSSDFSKYIHVYKLLNLTEEQEIEVLNSVLLLVQSLEFPQGLLLECFKCLYKEGAILPNTFKLWSNADQSDSKGVALKQLHTFYQMLTEHRNND